MDAPFTAQMLLCFSFATSRIYVWPALFSFGEVWYRTFLVFDVVAKTMIDADEIAWDPLKGRKTKKRKYVEGPDSPNLFSLVFFPKSYFTQNQDDILRTWCFHSYNPFQDMMHCSCHKRIRFLRFFDPETSFTSLILLFKKAAVLFLPSGGHLGSRGCSFIPLHSVFPNSVSR